MIEGPITGPTNEPAGDPFNPIFETLVEDPDDIEGLIAYGRYKVAKREWIERHVERTRTRPTDAQLREYGTLFWTPTLLQGLREQAESALANYASATIEAAKPGIREDAIRGKIEADLKEFRAAIDQSKKGEGWRSIGYSILGAAAYTAILIILALLLAWGGVDFIGILQKVRPPS